MDTECDVADEESMDDRELVHEPIPYEEQGDREQGDRGDRVQKPKLTSYEEIRKRNMQMNSERLATLNLQTLASNLIPAGQKKGKEKISGDESEDYHPENDSEDSRDEDEVFDAPPTKIKRTKQ